MASIMLVVLALLTLGVYVFRSIESREMRKLPLINGRRFLEFSNAKAKERFQAHAQTLLKAGFAKGKTLFRLVTDAGVEVILSPQYAHALRNHPALSHSRRAAEDFHGGIPGFQTFRNGWFPLQTVRVNLTQALDALTKPLSVEAKEALVEFWTEQSDWHEIPVTETIIKVVSRLSARVFVGENLCRDPEWQSTAQDYAAHVFPAANELRQWPKLLRPYVHWLLPSCRQVRQDVEHAYAVLAPVLEKSREKIRRPSNGDGKLERSPEALDWVDNMPGWDNKDRVIFQLGLSMAAIHTTSDLLSQLLFNLAEKKELIKALQEEIITVIGSEGWKKSSLYKLKLMDSVIKETLRLKPPNIVAMRAYTEEAVTLPEGTTLPKGTLLSVASMHMWDEAVYPDAQEFQGDRFFRARQIPDQANLQQAVTTGPEFLSFGHGRNACPGRFFAIHEVKISLCHILLKYDWKLVGGRPPVHRMGYGLAANTNARIRVRRRHEEIPS